MLYRNYGLNIEYSEMLLGGSAIDETGVPLPKETIDGVRECDLFCWAIGGPKVGIIFQGSLDQRVDS